MEAVNSVAGLTFDQADSVVINSGNIINSYPVRKKVTQRISEELEDSISDAFAVWRDCLDSDWVTIPEPMPTLNVNNVHLKHTFDKEERKLVKISAKIFMSQWEPLTVKNAIKNVREALGVDDIDTAIVSFPETITKELRILNFEKVLAVWKEMELMVNEGLIRHIGVTDFDSAALNELYQSAEVKPIVDQLSAAKIFSIPEDLVKLSERYDIELLSHDDASHKMMTKKALQNIIEDKIPHVTSTSQWLPSYVVRYSVVARHRGIIRSKGYIVEAQQKNSDDFY